MAFRASSRLLGVTLAMQAAWCVAQSTDRFRAPWPERQIERPAREVRSITSPEQVSDDEAVDRKRSAARIFGAAEDALQQGDVMLARRRLEVLIETYPETPAAAMAREQLSSVFGRQRDARPRPSIVDEPRGDRPSLIPTQSSNEPEPSPGPPVGDSRATRSPPPTQAETSLRQRRQLQDERRVQQLGYDFQMAAGDRVFFAETSSDLGTRARAVLAGQARWLERNADLPIVVEAHADDYRGNRVLDAELSQRRAQTVVERLVENGVDRARIIVHFYGRDRPVAICQGPECAAQNRRVVVRIGNGRDSGETRRTLDEPALATAPRRNSRGSVD